MDMRCRRGFTLIELMFVVTVIGILSAMATPALTRAKMAADESSAIASLRVVYSGQLVFSVTCGNGLYAPTLENLAQPVGAAPGYLSPDLGGPAPIVKSGYEFDMDSTDPVAGTSCNGGSLAVTYHATADPLPGRGRRYFGSNSGGAIFQSTETLFGSMPDVGAAPAPAVSIGQ